MDVQLTLQDLEAEKRRLEGKLETLEAELEAISDPELRAEAQASLAHVRQEKRLVMQQQLLLMQEIPRRGSELCYVCDNGCDNGRGRGVGVRWHYPALHPFMSCMLVIIQSVSDFDCSQCAWHGQVML